MVLESEATRIEDAAWEAYRPRYQRHMADALRNHRSALSTMLRHGAECCGGHLTLVCFCTRSDQCHRTLAGRFLAEHSGGGAVFAGECEGAAPRGYAIVCVRGVKRPTPLPLFG